MKIDYDFVDNVVDINQSINVETNIFKILIHYY
jgi:hypothetical protein